MTRSAVRHAQPGFVMPVVVLLALVGGLVVSVALARSAQRYTIVRQQLDGYRDAHREFGVKSITADWLRYTLNQSIDGMTGGTGTGGPAFSIRLPDGSTIEAAFYPAQATALIEPVGLSESDARIAERVRDLLAATLSDGGFAESTRRIGPLAIDATRASPEVIRALASAALDNPDSDQQPVGDEFAGLLLTERDSAEVDPAMLLAIAETIGLDEDQRETVTRLFLGDAMLWRSRVVFRPTGQQTRQPGRQPGGDPARTDTYEGIVELPGGGLAIGGSGHANEVFLSWERIETPPGYTVTGDR